MKMMSRHDALSTICNTTFGKSGSQTGQSSVTASFAGDTLTLKYTTIVHFAEERSLQMQMASLSNESLSYLDQMVAAIKKSFKEMTGENLKLKEVSSNDSVELISALSMRKVAYYRRIHVLEIV
jgi:TRAP-type mannitol/chloroaromatic compound transport system substrate-binding protein